MHRNVALRKYRVALALGGVAAMLSLGLGSIGAWAQGTGASYATGSGASRQGGTTDDAEGLPLKIIVGASVAHDSNVLRLPDSAPEPVSESGETGKSDRFATAQLGVRFAKEYSLQSFQLQLDNTVYRYDKFELLDRDELNYRAQWRWQSGARFDGALLAARTERLVGIEESLDRSNNVRVETTYDVTLGMTIQGGLRVLAGVSEFDLENSVPSAEYPSNRQTGGHVGLTYLTGAGNSVTLTRRARRGTNSDADAVVAAGVFDPNFRVDETDLALVWQVSPLHGLRGRVARIEYRYDNASERDFAGNTIDGTYTWAPTERVALALIGTRTVSPWLEESRASYRVETGVALAPTWRASEKTGLAMRFFRGKNEYRGALTGASGDPRSDTVRTAELTGSWAPRRSVGFTAGLRRERRASSDALYDYDVTVAEVAVAAEF